MKVRKARKICANKVKEKLRKHVNLCLYFFSGNVVNKAEHGSLDWVHICEKASKVITFIDLAGHERYLKTTVFGND